MTRTELDVLMKKFFIFENELEDIFEFCSILLEERAKETEREEPYATKCIRRYKDAAYEVFDLQHYVEDIMRE